MSDPIPARPMFGEVAVAGGGRDITAGFIEPLLRQPGDPILRAQGFDFRVYQDILRDDQVKAVFQQRRLAVVSHEWQVEPGGDAAVDGEAAEALKENLQALRLDDITDKMLFGLFYGWSVAEVMWGRQGGRIVIDDIRVRKRERFRWDKDGQLRMLLPGRPEGEIMPPGKFWTFSIGADNDDEPYGLGLGHWLYWPVFFKRNNIKFWLIALEKFGSPTAKGTFPQSALDDDKKKLLEALRAIQTEAAIIVPEGMVVELIEATRGGASTHEALCNRMDAAIAKVVLSQTMTTDNGSSRAQGEVHMDVRQEVIKADADLVCGSFNEGPAAWLTAWNFPGAKTPRLWRRIEDEPDLRQLAERDRLLTEIGYKPTPDYIQETYGPGFEVVAPPPPPVVPPAAPGAPPAELGEACPGCGKHHHDMAEAAGDAIDDAVARMLADGGWEPLMEPVLAPLLAAADEAADLAELDRRLSALLPKMDLAPLAESLARARLSSRLAGLAGEPLAD